MKKMILKLIKTYVIDFVIDLLIEKVGDEVASTDNKIDDVLVAGLTENREALKLVLKKSL